MKNLLFTMIALLFVQSAFACSAGFTNSNTSSGNNLLQITFTNTSVPGTLSSGQYAQYIVRFGDGVSSYIGYNANMAHNYSSSGTYTAKIIALVIDSPTQTIVCGDSTTASVTVNYPSCGSTISVSYGSGGAATLTANTPAGTSGMTYSWDYGDSNTGSGSPTTHTYASNGYYTVTLTATSSAPCTWTSTLTIHITNAALTFSCSTAHASFNTSTSYNVATFTNTSTNPTSSNSFYINYTMYYGDGSNGTSSTHTYATAGTYTVCLAMHWLDSLTSAQICSDSICHTVIITSAPNIITGYVHFDSTGCPVSAPTYKVWLITLDASTHILAAIDSINSTTNPNYTFPSIGGPTLAAGTYRVKAMVTNATSSPAPIPTYGLDSLHWSGADSFAYSGSGVSSGHNINLQCGTPISGPGFIGGDVTLGANKGTKTTGGPTNIEILISNASGTTLGYAMTNNGHFSFSHLPVASGSAGTTYTLYPEVLGYQNTPWNVTLYQNNDSVNNIEFHIATGPKTTKPVTTGIENITATPADISVYPNPTTGIIDISSSAAAHAVISDVVGHKAYETNINSGNTQLNLSNLNAGMYFISIKSADLNYSNKIIIQH